MAVRDRPERVPSLGVGAAWERAHTIVPRPGEYASVAHIADTVDLEGDVERAELAMLVAKALALLPPATCAALIERYMRDAPQAAVALQLGVSESAVEARLHRGKLALRRALAPVLRADKPPFDLTAGETGWDTTRVWHPLCGRRPLQGQFDPARGAFALRCPACSPTTGAYCSYEWPTLFQGCAGRLAHPACPPGIRVVHPHVQKQQSIASYQRTLVFSPTASSQRRLNRMFLSQESAPSARQRRSRTRHRKVQRRTNLRM